MNPDKFSRKKTGTLVRTAAGQPDWTFVPEALPRKMQISNDLWPLLAQARENLARLDGIGQTLPSVDLLLRPLQSREALRSSSLEGTFATAEELLLFELEPRDAASPADRANDWREVSNYAASLREGLSMLDKLPLSLRLIRRLHQVLLSGVRGRDRAPGEFRRVQVHIGRDKRYVPPPVNELDSCLDDFEKFLNDAGDVDPLIRCYVAHYQFEAIHPFIDGNGRVGRVLLSLCAYLWCGLSKPWLYMSAFYERNKDEYIDRLFAVSASGDWEQWFRFCLRGTVEECRDAVRRCNLLLALRKEFGSRVRHPSPRTHAIVESLFSSPIVTISGLSRRLNVSYPTARVDVQRLVDAGILRAHPTAYPKAFLAPQIMEAAYDEP